MCSRSRVPTAASLITDRQLVQDFLYRKAVASCCRALWCCCSGPCCSKYDFDDELDASTDKVSHVAHKQDEAGSSSTNSIDLVERMEQGTGVGIGTVITSPPPLEATPARSTKKWVVPCLAPSVPRRPQGLAPRRPARPTRKAAHRHSQAKTPRAQRVQTLMAASSSGHQVREQIKTKCLEWSNGHSYRRVIFLKIRKFRTKLVFRC